MTETLAAIAEEAKRLDSELPDWTDRVNVDTLDMADPDLCMMGQLDMWGNHLDYPRLAYVWPDGAPLDEADGWCHIARRAWLHEIDSRVRERSGQLVVA